jgi:predicted nucleic acid-binding Zn ribbon protein
MTDGRKDNNLQACVICGRYFIRRKDRICSRECAERADKQETK